MVFAWDEAKEKTSRRKHGISFDTSAMDLTIAIRFLISTVWLKEKYGGTRWVW